MVGVEQIDISKPVNLEYINQQIKTLGTESKKLAKMVERLQFIRLRYLGYSVVEASNIQNITVQTGYNWQKAWNESGWDSLEPKFAGGKPAKMTPEQKEMFKSAVDRDMMTTLEAGAYLERTFQIKFTPKHVREMLRKMGFRHAKPYDIDYRRPENAETILKKDLEMRWVL